MTILVDDETLEAAKKKSEKAEQLLVAKLERNGYTHAKAVKIVKGFRGMVRRGDGAVRRTG